MLDPRTQAAREILNATGTGAVKIAKPIRAGATTSMVVAANEMGKRILAIEPTTRILKETIKHGIRVPGNAECPKEAENLEAFPILRELPISLPNCDKCKQYGLCPVTSILRTKNFDTVGITLAKVRALMLANGETPSGELTVAGRIREVLSSIDIVLIDEAHLLAFGSIPSVRACSLPSVSEKFKALGKVRDLWNELLVRHAETITELMERAKNGPSQQHLSKHIFVPEPLSWRALQASWKELRALAKARALPDEAILVYRDSIDVLSYSWGAAHYVSEDEGRAGHVVISGSRGKGQRAISEFLQSVVPTASHIYVSGTLIEQHSDFFKELSGKQVEATTFPDHMKASEKVTLIPDTWKLTSRNFYTNLDRIVDQIRLIIERENKPIYILCPSARKAGELYAAMKQAKLGGAWSVDYYRSDRSIGVARDERACVAIGMAEIPANAMDPMAWGKDETERWANSRALRLQAVHAATWQSINRVRDPEGKQESRIYMIGAKISDVRQLARWGTNRQVKVTNIQDTKANSGEAYRRANFKVITENEIEHCNIFGDEVHKANSGRRKAFQMIDKIEIYDTNKIQSENRLISSINVYRKNEPLFGFYNFPSNENEVETTTISLYNTFCHRADCYARQFKDSSGKWGFSKVLNTIPHDVLIDHVDGKKTIGVYELGLNDDVIWGCYDVDTHDEGNNGDEARAKVHALVDVLDVYNVPCLVESSGSVGSYHIWIFFKRTATYNAFRFMRQIASEAKVKDIEIWPKQKRLGKDGKYGNLVKLPICLHNRTGNRSAFVDADTFEPLEGFVPFPGRVVLLELPELTGESLAMPKPTKPNNSHASCSTLDHCMLNALVDGVPLEGSNGHNLRVAIAVKAAFVGMKPEEIANLFKDQPDFDYEYSLSKAKEISERGYSPWSCATLCDNCGGLVTRYCSTCPFATVAFKEHMVQKGQ